MPHTVVKSPDHNRHRSLGWLATSWIEHFCIHGPGDIQGKPLSYRRGDAIPLSDELTLLQVDCYALDINGRRLYDSVFYSRPKGADKSGEASRIALFEALGPCRFAGWAKGGERYEWLDFVYEYQPGEPIGRPIVYPFLRILATEEGQTGNVYDSIFYNLKEGPLREAFARSDDVGLTRVYLPDGGEIRPSTASSAAKDGGKESWCDFDESHLYVTPELRRMYATVRRNMTKRRQTEPWSLETSTMYEPGAGSIAQDSHEMAELLQEGKMRRHRFFFDHRQAPADTDLDNEDSLRAGLRESFGDAYKFADVERIISEIWDTRAETNDSVRYYLNQATAAADAWITPQEWDRLTLRGYKVAPGAEITLGLDPSDSDDHTVLTGCEVATGYEWPIGIWVPQIDPDGRFKEINKMSIDKAVRDAFADFDVVGFFSDAHPMQDYIDRWTVEFGQGLCAKVSERDPIKFYMNNREADATRMVEAFHTAIIDGVDVSHPGDRLFSQYFYNAKRNPGRYGVSVRKGKRVDKIDAVPSAALARWARQVYLSLPESRKRRKGTVGFTWLTT